MVIKMENKLDTRSEEDILFSQMTEAAWKEYDKGNFVRMSEEEFLAKLDAW